VDDLLSVTAAARMAGVSPDTIRNWCDKGDLPSVRTAGGHRRISSRGLDSLLRDGPSKNVQLTPDTRDLDVVFDAWRDQIERLRPFVERRFDSESSLQRAAVALEGYGLSRRGGLIGELEGLLREIHDALDSSGLRPQHRAS